MIRLTILATSLLLAAGVAMAESKGSFADSRGYRNCVRAADSESTTLQLKSRYFINEQNGSRVYYLNGVARPSFARESNAGPAPIRIACRTTASGHRVLGVDVSAGQYAALMVSTPELAAK